MISGKKASTKPNEKSVMIWAHRLLKTHGAQADRWAIEVSEKHRLSNDAYGVVKWQTIAKRIAQLRCARELALQRKTLIAAKRGNDSESATHMR